MCNKIINVASARDEVPFDLAIKDAQTLRNWLELQLSPNVKRRLVAAMKLLTNDELADVMTVYATRHADNRR